MATPLLEIQVHLSNGSTHRFAQNDPQHMDALVEKLGGRFFKQDNLTFFGSNSVATFPGSAVSGLSLLVDPLPDALQKMLVVPAMGVRDIVEVTTEEYQTLLSQRESIIEGREFLSSVAIEMISGYRFTIAVDVGQAMTSIQERQMIQHAFDGPQLVCRRRGGGLSIWNRAHMVSQRFSPRPDVPISAIPAEFLDVLGS